MSLISLSNVSYSLGARNLFEKLSFAINRGERTALVAPNGAGKSTLLRIISGEVEADEGTIARRGGVVIEYVPQIVPPTLHTVTLYEALSQKLPHSTRHGGGEYLVEHRLTAAGFDPSRHEQSVGSLSGGEANRLMVARALMNDPDLVLLDEPTNHMDIKQVAAFERFIQEELQAAILLVSHDRSLLDTVTSHTLFLRDRRVHSFSLPFTKARDALRSADSAALERRKGEERELDRLRESANRLAEWGKVYSNEKFSYRAKSMQKRIERLEEQVTELPGRRRASVSLDSALGTSEFVLEVNDLSLETPSGVPLVTIERLAVRRGERLAVVGPNGCGKSTLLKAIVGRWSNDSRGCAIRHNPSATLGYYDQELAHFAREERLAQAVRERCSLSDQQITAELVNAGFVYGRHRALVSTLSGGERARLTFLILKLQRPNVLILDEPTNHLDVEGIEELEESLVTGGGTILFVSHDRAFLNRVATRVLELR